MFKVTKLKGHLFIVFTIIILLLVINSNGICAAKYKFNLPTTNRLWEEGGIQVMLFAQSVMAKSAGEIEIDIYPNAEWGGSDEDYLQSVQLGNLDMAIVASSTLGLYTNALSAYDVPFLFKNPVDETLFTFESSEKFKPLIEKKLEQATKDCKFIVLSVGPIGRRDVFSNKPVDSVEDLKGMKIRTMASNIQVDAFNLLGAVATPMAYSECFSALQTKVVDGMENSPTAYVLQRFVEVAPYWVGTNHYSCCHVIVMSKKAWDSLPDAYQNIIKNSAITATYTIAQWAVGADEVNLKGVIPKVAKKMILLTPEEQLKLRQDVLPKLLDKYSEDIGMDVISKLAEEDEIVRKWYEKNK